MKKRSGHEDELEKGPSLDRATEVKLLKLEEEDEPDDPNVALLETLEAKGFVSMDAFRNFLHRGASIHCCDQVGILLFFFFVFVSCFSPHFETIGRVESVALCCCQRSHRNFGVFTGCGS